jgi:uncharacterized membrane protein YhaH (DUF805 family)
MDPKVIADDFLNVIKNHYFDVNGRVRRQDFWYFVLACVVVDVIAAIVCSIIPFIGILVPVIGFALLPPLAGMGARRLQDAGHDGRLVWALIIPIAITQIFSLLAIMSGPYGALGFLYFIYSIGWLVNLVGLVAFIACVYFWVQDGTPGPNQYGPDPKGRTAAAA